MDWVRLVKERNEWVAHNFPDNKLPKPQESILGMIEELGELAHSHLKELQNIRGTAEEHQALAKDAIGDVTIYLLGVLSESGYRPDWDLAEEIPNKPEMCIFQACCFLGRIAVFSTSGAYDRVFELNVDALCGELDAYCVIRGWDYEAIVLETWARVSKRDWIADPAAGGE